MQRFEIFQILFRAVFIFNLGLGSLFSNDKGDLIENIDRAIRSGDYKAIKDVHSRLAAMSENPSSENWEIEKELKGQSLLYYLHAVHQGFDIKWDRKNKPSIQTPFPASANLDNGADPDLLKNKDPSAYKLWLVEDSRRRAYLKVYTFQSSLRSSYGNALRTLDRFLKRSFPEKTPEEAIKQLKPQFDVEEIVEDLSVFRETADLKKVPSLSQSK